VLDTEGWLRYIPVETLPAPNTNYASSVCRTKPLFRFTGYSGYTGLSSAYRSDVSGLYSQGQPPSCAASMPCSPCCLFLNPCVVATLTTTPCTTPLLHAQQHRQMLIATTGNGWAVAVVLTTNQESGAIEAAPLPPSSTDKPTSFPCWFSGSTPLTNSGGTDVTPGEKCDQNELAAPARCGCVVASLTPAQGCGASHVHHL
jgi:hypothetical protein